MAKTPAKERRPVCLFVGYRLRAVPGVEALVPDIQPSRALKDETKIAADVASRRAAFLAAAVSQPYTGMLDAVVFFDPAAKQTARWATEGGTATANRQPLGPRPRVCLMAREWLLKSYPTAWAGELAEHRPAEVLFIGFEPKKFLKALGIECSLPGVERPLPPRLWYGNADHRDIGTAVAPDDFKHVSLDLALRCRRPGDEESAAKWDAVVKDWPGPGSNPESDVWLAYELAVQLGLYRP